MFRLNNLPVVLWRIIDLRLLSFHIQLWSFRQSLALQGIVIFVRLLDRELHNWQFLFLFVNFQNISLFHVCRGSFILLDLFCQCLLNWLCLNSYQFLVILFIFSDFQYLPVHLHKICLFCQLRLDFFVVLVENVGSPFWFFSLRGNIVHVDPFVLLIRLFELRKMNNIVLFLLSPPSNPQLYHVVMLFCNVNIVDSALFLLVRQTVLNFLFHHDFIGVIDVQFVKLAVYELLFECLVTNCHFEECVEKGDSQMTANNSNQDDSISDSRGNKTVLHRENVYTHRYFYTN